MKELVGGLPEYYDAQETDVKPIVINFSDVCRDAEIVHDQTIEFPVVQYKSENVFFLDVIAYSDSVDQDQANLGYPLGICGEKKFELVVHDT